MDQATKDKLRRPNDITELSGRDTLIWEQKMGMSMQYWIGTLNPQKIKTDQFGNDVLDEDGQLVYETDLDAVHKFRDNQSTKAMYLSTWLFSRSKCDLPNLKFDDVLELSTKELYAIPKFEEVEDDGTPKEIPSEPKESTPDTLPLTTT